MSAAQEVIPASDIAAAREKRVSLIEKMADKYHLDPRNMMATLKATAFRGDVSNEQMAALLVVADAHNLNPWLKEIYAFPSRQGIVPIVGVDGWARIINEHPEFDGMEFALTGELGEKTDTRAYTCTIHRKDREHPVSVTEYMAECRRPTDPWNTHPLRMLRHKAMIQCARLAFSFAGIYDPDEGERVLAAEEAIDVTPQPPKAPTLTIDAETGKPAFRNADGSEYVKPQKLGPKRLREVIEGLVKHSENNNGPELLKIRRSLSNDEWMHAYGELRSWEATAVKKVLAEAEKADAGMQLDAWSIELLRKCTNEAQRADAYRAIQDAYADNGADVPESVDLVADEMRSSMGAV